MILPTEIKNIIFDYVDTETLLKSKINYNDLLKYFIFKYKKKFSNISIKKYKNLNIVDYLIEKNPELFTFTSFKDSEILVKNEYYNIFLYFLDKKYDKTYINNHCINYCVKNIKLLEYIIEKYGYDGYENIFTCICRNYEWKKYSNFINKNMKNFDNDSIKKYLSTPHPYSDIILSGDSDKLKCYIELRNNSVYKSNIEIFTRNNYIELFEYFHNKTYNDKKIEIHNIINIFINGIEILEEHKVFLSKELFISNITKICINYDEIYCNEYYYDEIRYDEIHCVSIKKAKTLVFIYFINKYNEYFHKTFEFLFYRFVDNGFYWNIKILIDNGFKLDANKYKYMLENFAKICDEKKEIFDCGIIKDKLSICKIFANMCYDNSLYQIIKNDFPYDDELIFTIIKNKLNITLSYMKMKGLITMEKYIS